MVPLGPHPVAGAVLVGALWGCTNPLIKLGTAAAEESRRPSGGVGPLAQWAALLSTPAFLIPQLLNASGSILFTLLLAASDLSLLVPLANATALALNAVVDWRLGQAYRPGRMCVGLACVLAGGALCATAA
ncbi:unnamed protein product [Ostreobium quekettii]|uniref:Transmembrane protein 234 n=1 Tax=Ostreobium quekettii TaxID=121088 RepID=A0A8S1IT45_9CHLO|nr:unnamed protein product [Ostreobium quekettii]